MKDFNDLLNTIEEPKKRERLEEIFTHISEKFPELEREIKWNQPMFTHHGTYIIGFSVAKHHIAVSPEAEVLDFFEETIKEAGYQRTKMLYKIKWSQSVSYDLLDKMITYNLEDKKDTTSFWR